MSKWTTYYANLLSGIPNSFSRIPNLPGVYAIYYAEELVYIGQSESLRDRIRYHEKLGPAHKEDGKVKVKLCPKLGEWHMVSFRLLKRLRPRLNKQFVIDSGKNKYTYDLDLVVRIKKLLGRGYTRAWIARKLNKVGHQDINRRPWTEVSVGIVAGVIG